jgi:hypothetical protein
MGRGSNPTFPPVPLGAKSQQGEQLRQVDEPFRLPALLRRQFLSAVLPIEKRRQALVNALWKTKTLQILGHLDL